MRWQKLGNIFCPNKIHPWMNSHAANPITQHLYDGVFKVYFTCRDADNRSYISYVHMDMDNQFKVTFISDEPILVPGEAGTFDDSGVAMGYLLEVNGRIFLYYLGWNLKVTVPWLNTIGLAIYNPVSEKFEKVSRAPIMDRSDEDPFTISYPSVMYQEGIYRMWYGSNLKWGKLPQEMNHVFKYAESNDGIKWATSNKIHVNLEHPNEYALSKPFVILDNAVYKMWYSYRGNGTIDTYRIGYAESGNGFDWTRKDDEAGIDVSAAGWDSEMIEYPSIFNYNNRKYMLYNGNGYGKTGFGMAVLTD